MKSSLQLDSERGRTPFECFDFELNAAVVRSCEDSVLVMVLIELDCWSRIFVDPGTLFPNRARIVGSKQLLSSEEEFGQKLITSIALPPLIRPFEKKS
jgi:hypothetical protein